MTKYLNHTRYTGNSSDWGLPEGSVLGFGGCQDTDHIIITSDFGHVLKHRRHLYGKSTSFNYRLISLPKGYECNKKGEVVKLNISARDKIYTGKVSDCGLPDGTILTCFSNDDWTIDGFFAFPTNGAYVVTHLSEQYKIKSLPDGYKFNDKGEIVEVEEKRYWDGKEKLEVGMWVEWIEQELRVLLSADLCGLVILDDEGRHASAPFVQLKPIDTRSNKEKAIDKVMTDIAYFCDHESSIIAALDYAYDAWVIKGKG